MRIGFTELLVVFFVALVVLGPDKLPGYAKKLGEALSAFRKASDEATKEIRENIVEPLEEAQKPLREAMEPLEELEKSVRGNVREVQTSLRDVGKGKPSAPRKSTPDNAETAKEPGRTSKEADDAETAKEPDKTSQEPDGGEVPQERGETVPESAEPAVEHREEPDNTTPAEVIE